MNVPVGPATIVGYFLSAFAAGGTVLATAEGELAGPGKWLAIISAVTAISTNLGRQLQATRTPAKAFQLEQRPLGNKPPPFEGLPSLGSVPQQQQTT